MMAYREVLHKWAGQHLPEGAIVTNVKIEYGEGHVWSEITIEDPYLYVTISYTLNGEGRTLLEADEAAVKVLSSMGELLTELFAIEED